MKLAIIGGDLRTVKLIELLAKDKNTLKIWGFENNEEILQLAELEKRVEICNSIEEAIEDIEIVLGPTPFTKDKEYVCTKYTNQKLKIEELTQKLKDKLLLAGSIPNNVLDQVEALDILKDENLVILNAISTVEGTINIAIKETQKNLYKSNILVIGYGRIGKILVDRLIAFKANVYCSARGKDLTWINTLGGESIKYENLNEQIHKFDIIINTVPVLILNEERLRLLNKNVLLIDVASAPGGIDFKAAQEMNIRTLWELGIPGKVAPLSSAEYMKETIYNIIKRREEENK